MKKSMVHWNGCHCCAIDIETTGLDPLIHEITQIALVPLDSNLNVRKDVLPFYILMRPDNLEVYSTQAQRVTGITKEALKDGHDKFKAIDLLEEWIDKLGLPHNVSGYNRCKIIPLGYNYVFDRSFILKWLGHEQYEEWFHHQFRDPMITANFLNDQAAMHAELAPHPKLTLGAMCGRQGIVHDNKHDALGDAIATAALYKKMASQGMII